MRLFFGMILALFVSTASAQEIGTHACDTDYQAALFADHLRYNAAATASEVNAEVRVPDACIAAPFLLLKGDVVATIRTHAALWNIRKVIVVAVWKGRWLSIPPQEYFAAFQVEEA